MMSPIETAYILWRLQPAIDYAVMRQELDFVLALSNQTRLVDDLVLSWQARAHAMALFVMQATPRGK
jgi:hypothetical protein